MLVQLRVGLLGRSESIVKPQLAKRRLLLSRCALVERAELVMHKLEDAKLLDLTVDSAAVRTLLDLAATLVDALADLRAAHIVDVWPSQLAQEHATVWRREE